MVKRIDVMMVQSRTCERLQEQRLPHDNDQRDAPVVEKNLYSLSAQRAGI
jgi:hypothetical protein